MIATSVPIFMWSPVSCHCCLNWCHHFNQKTTTIQSTPSKVTQLHWTWKLSWIEMGL